MLPAIGSKIRVTTDWEDTQKSMKVFYPRYQINEGIVSSHGEGELADYFYLTPLSVDNTRVYNHIPQIPMNRVVKIEDLTTNTTSEFVPEPKVKDRVWKIKSKSKEEYYHVRLSKNHLTCNCYAGLMNKKCWHKSHITEILDKEKGV